MLQRIVFLITIFDVLTNNEILAEKRRFDIEVYGMNCTSTWDGMKQLECNFRKLATNRYAFNGTFMLYKNLDPEAEAEAKLYLSLPDYSRNATLVNIKMNICDFITIAFKMPLVETLLTEVRRSSNIPLFCPIKGNYSYQFVNAMLTDKILPPYVPAINYKTEIKIYLKQMFLGALQITGAVVKRNK